MANRLTPDTASRLYFTAWTVSSGVYAPKTDLAYTATWTTKNSQQRIGGVWQTGVSLGTIISGSEGDAIAAGRFIQHTTSGPNIYSIDVSSSQVTNSGGVDAIRLQLAVSGAVFLPTVHPIDVASVTRHASGAAVASVTGDVAGKVLGGGSGTISGVGARVVDYNGDNVAPAATALSSSTWTSARAGYLDTLNTGVTVSTNNDKTGYSLTAVTGLGNQTANLTGNLSGSVGSVGAGGITSTSFGAGAITAAAIADGAIDAATFAADVDAEILSYIVDDATRVDASALNTASAAVGSNGAGLTEAGGTGDQLTAVPWNVAWDAEVQSECADALNAYDPPTNSEMEARTILAASYATATSIANLLSTAMTEDYPTDGSTASVAQALYLILAHLQESSITGTTKTVKKLDGATTAATFTLNSSTAPTSITRSS